MRLWSALILFTFLIACGPSEEQRRAQREREQQDQKSAAFRAGKIAHDVAKETEKVAAAAGRKLAEDARKAKEGWNQQARDDRDKARAKNTPDHQ